LAAVKRVQGMRMIGPAWRRTSKATVGRAVAAPPTNRDMGE